MMKKVGYINLTPRWAELVSTWQMIVNDAVRVRRSDQMERFWGEYARQAELADRYNDLVTALRDEGWADSAFEAALRRGRELQEVERNTIREG